MQEKRSKLIVIEGSDCSGKTTQINLLIEKLKQERIDFALFDFPDYTTPTGKIVKMYLNNEFGPANAVPPRIASLFYAQDRYSQKDKIERALNEGKIVILDRYVESNMGHQGGKIQDKAEREEFFKWLEDLEYGNFSLPRPDAVIFLYVPFSVSQILKKRRVEKQRREGKAEKKEDGHEDDIEHLKNAEKSYLHLADFYGWTKINCAPDGTINSLRKPEDIGKEVWQRVREIIRK